MVRITGGFLKGRQVVTSRGMYARYTSAKVRKAIFDMVNPAGLNILDLFAGSGLFAIEALSRGAQSATCVEKDRGMVSIIKKNKEKFLLQEKLFLIPKDVRRAIPFLYKFGAKYDIIFMDPPYEGEYIGMTLKYLLRFPIYGEGAIFIFEYSKRMIYAFADFERISRKIYGETVVEILKRRG